MAMSEATIKEYIQHEVKDSVLKLTNSRLTAIIIHIGILTLVTGLFFYISDSNKAELKEDIRANKAELKEDIRANKAELKEDIQANKIELQKDLNQIKTALKIQ